MIVKIDITSYCQLEDLPEVKRVFTCYRAPDNEVTFCCSAQKMIFCEELMTQIDYKDGVTCERMEEIEDLFACVPAENTYYAADLIDRLPRKEWGSLPDEGTVGCVIETKERGYDEEDYEEDEINDFSANGG